MLLYHYSKSKYENISSQIARSGSIVDNGDDFQYEKNVSLFLEPIPRNISKLLNGEHEFWKSGNTIYEYTVDVSKLPKHIPFKLVESYEKTDLIYKKQNWNWDDIKKNPKIREENLKEISDLEFSLGFKGFTKTMLIKAINKVLPKLDMSKDYLLMYKRHKKHPEDELIKKYAPTVPHLMLYPAKVPIEYESVELITLE